MDMTKNAVIEPPKASVPPVKTEQKHDVKPQPEAQNPDVTLPKPKL
jgi:hypothetical protein